MTGPIETKTATAADIAGIDTMMRGAYDGLPAGNYPPSTLIVVAPIIGLVQSASIASGTSCVAVDRDGATLRAGGWTRSPPQRRALARIAHI